MALMEGSSFDFSRFDVLWILVLRRFGFDILLVVLLKSSNGLFFFDDLFPLCPVDRREVVPVTIFSVKTVTDLNTRVPPLLSVFTSVLNVYLLAVVFLCAILVFVCSNFQLGRSDFIFVILDFGHNKDCKCIKNQ